MTTLSPLHVVVPSELDVVSPPTPYTPKSANSLDQPDVPPSSPRQNSSAAPMSFVDVNQSQAIEVKHAEGKTEPTVHQSGSEPDGESRGQEIMFTEMRVTAPDTLPPSPPLTDNEGREEEKHVIRQEQPPTLRPPDEDILNWQSSVDEREGSYHEDDLGYSTEVSPVEPRAAPGLGTTSQDILENGIPSPRNGIVSDHPLRLETHAPSPPPWETIEPPESNNSGIHATNGIARHPNPATSRPLIPHSSYYFGPPPVDAAYGTDPIGHIGLHHPREIVRVERDYSGGEIIQFSPVYPLELEGRITPTHFLETINSINEVLISAHSLRHSFLDNALSFFTLQLSKLVTTTHYEKEMDRLHEVIGELNRRLYNPVGLNILWPRRVGFMFLEIEYYVSQILRALSLLCMLTQLSLQ